MARVKQIAKDITEGAASSEEAEHLSEEEELLSGVDADPSELMRNGNPPPTLRFGPSLMSAALIESYVERGYFPAGVCPPPQGEETPDPRMGSVWCFATSLSLGFVFLLTRRSQRFLPGSR